GTWYRFRDTREHRCFWRERVWCALPQSCPRSRDRFALVLFCVPVVRSNRWSVGSHCFKCHADFQYWRGPDDDRCAVDFFLDGGDVYILDRHREKSAFLVALATYGLADWVRLSVQIHERVRTAFGFDRARTCSAATTGIATARRIFVDRDVSSLHDSAG